ncbi:dTDP-4-dehydrorhamnose 3,5-epimerase [Hyphomonas sp.]|uniref:dTDP-4-dehydrorhamnose 3,5-epimerase n=1 Tax=Hyphomonas sp. TaxID=87 RepID=UPI00391AEAE4
MIIRPVGIDGAAEIDLQRRGDARGFFARTFCADTFAAHGLPTGFVQANMSWSERAGTLRGLHFQRAPDEEDKLIRCVRGAVFDVVADLRPESPTYLKWVGIELAAENRKQVLIPKGCAHGFQTLMDDTEVAYMVSAPYAPQSESGVRWDDPALAISWPLPPTELSDKDRSWPFLNV